MLEEQTRQTQKQKSGITLLDIFRVLSKQKNLLVFRTIAAEGVIDREMIEKMTKINRRDRSTSLSELFRIDLIRKKSGKYCLT